MQKFFRNLIPSLLIGFVVYLIFSAPRWLGFALSDLPLALDTVASMGAKLGCSGRHLSGFTLEQMKADIESYSPAATILALHEEGATITGSAFGSTASATYRPGLGCTLDIGDTAALDPVQVQMVPPDDSLPVRSDEQLQALADQLLLQDNAEGLDTRALVVVHDGVIAATSFGEGITASTPLLGWSMGKSVIALLIGRLEFLGNPLPGDTVPFPEWAGDVRGSIRLVHLLNMTSGLKWNETYLVGSDSTQMLFTDPSVTTRALASTYDLHPGSSFKYSSGTTNLLTTLLHRHLGGTQGLYTFFDQEIRKPLGLAHTTMEPDSTGVPIGSSYVYASATDWAKMGQLLLNRGTWNGTQLLSPEWIDRATAPNQSYGGKSYGYQLWLNRGDESPRWQGIPEDAYAMTGNREQTVMIIPSKNMVLVRLGWTAGSYPLEERFGKLIAAANAG